MRLMADIDNFIININLLYSSSNLSLLQLVCQFIINTNYYLIIDFNYLLLILII